MLELHKLNEAQRKAVTHGDGPLLVLAGPGSGKTFTITQRIFYLLFVKKLPPEQILVITFTKEAAKSMQDRFRQQSNRIYPVNFGTFHSVFYHILKASHILSGQKLLSIQQKKRLLFPILKKLFQNEKNENLTEEMTEILSAMSYLKNTNDGETARARLAPKWQPLFFRIYREYEHAKRLAGTLDFDDMLYECLRLLLENPDILQYWQDRFSAILIDEFQDINPVQYDIIKLLSQKTKSVFAVGDDDQAIYGFRGSQPACLRRFLEDYCAKQLLLNINYRSNEEIIKASALVIGENKDRFCKHLKAALEKENGQCTGAGDNKDKQVRVFSFENRQQQYEAIIRMLTEGWEEISCAVLFRTNILMQGFAVKLKKAGIPYEMKEKTQSIYEHFIAKDVLSYLKFASGDCRRELLLQILNKPSRYISREALGDGQPDFGKMADYYRNLSENAGGSAERNKCYGQQLAAIEKLAKQMDYLKSALPGAAVRYIRKAAGYEQYLKELAGREEEKLSGWLELLEWLSADAAGHNSLKEWLKAQEVYAQSMEEKHSMEEEHSMEEKHSGTGIVRLMTVHAAKGLEFDWVFVPDCNEKVFPHGQMPDTAACEEERRIFYVAMTRAKKNLELLCITGTRERPRLPSRFLNPLWKEYHSSTNSSNSQLSRYSSKASATRSYTSSSSIKDNSGSSLGSSGFSE